MFFEFVLCIIALLLYTVKSNSPKQQDSNSKNNSKKKKKKLKKEIVKNDTEIQISQPELIKPEKVVKIKTEKDLNHENQGETVKKHAVLVIKSKPVSDNLDKGSEWTLVGMIIIMIKIIESKKNSTLKQLTKKQRQNARKKELLKSIKSDQEEIQKERLEQYRKEQEKEALNELIRKDKEKIRVY